MTPLLVRIIHAMPYQDMNVVPPSLRTLHPTVHLRRMDLLGVPVVVIGVIRHRLRLLGQYHPVLRHKSVQLQWRRHWQGWARVQVGHVN